MVLYNFKKIQTVPNGKEFMDIILSKTQRKTPTVVHKGYAIARIRSFYMRKVKYTQQNFHDKLTQIIEDFPKLDAIHPFYADLMNVLYDKDHYKLALGQLNVARTLIDNVSKDYVRLLKYAESLYQSKTLKRSALGRMCTIIKRCNGSLIFLEQVRQHLGRLPSIDPTTRTLVIAGYPNVGKSSFVNKITRADVEVQPYAFTTKSLFVGHFDFSYLRWQVLDTPGILDHPLEKRNTIEMQTITALAHLRATVLFFVDISEQCGFSIDHQISLFNSISPLFANKPLVLVLTKIDTQKYEDLDEETKALIEKTVKETPEMECMHISCHTEEGVSEVVQRACTRLLDMRVEQKLKSRSSQKVLERLHVAVPQGNMSSDRPPCIPESVQKMREEQKSMAPMDGVESEKLDELTVELNPRDSHHKTPAWPERLRMTERDLELAAGGPGMYHQNLQKNYMLKDDEWKDDVIPEIMDGKNIADYIDPDIEKKMELLDKEEDERIAMLQAEMDAVSEESELDEEELAQLKEIKQKQANFKRKSRMARSQKPGMTRANAAIARPKTKKEFKAHLESMGLDSTKALERVEKEDEAMMDSDDDDGDVDMVSRGRAHEQAPRKRKRSVSKSIAMSQPRNKALRSASKPGRSTTRGPTDTSVKDEKTRMKLKKVAKKALRPFARERKAGEADRSIPTKMPKHLYSGKRHGQKTTHHR